MKDTNNMGNEKVEEVVQKYLRNTYKKKYDPQTYGIWDVHGEDPNCDLGGSHILPFLGRFEGRFIDILRYAVTLQNWESWGGGGDIKLSASVKKITPSDVINREDLIEKITEKRTEVGKLESELKTLDDQLQQEVKK